MSKLVPRNSYHDTHTLIIGGGMAAAKLVDCLNELHYSHATRVISEEPEFGYNRVLLPALLSGQACFSDLKRHKDVGQNKQTPVVHHNCTAVQVDLGRRRVRSKDGASFGYQKLVLATGSRAPIPSIPGAMLPGVSPLRSLADVTQVLAAAQDLQHIVVIGGGLLGLEIARALLVSTPPATSLKKVTVVHRQATLMNRQLDTTSAQILQSNLERQGLDFRLNRRLVQLFGAARATGVLLDDDSRLRADAVIFATGTVPNDGLASDAGIDCNQGILCDNRLQTSTPNVFAIGECARINGAHHALVEPVFQQAQVLAHRLCGVAKTFNPPAAVTRLKIPGTDVFSAGTLQPNTASSDQDEVAIRCGEVYRRLSFTNNRLTGAVLIGNVSGANAIAKLIDQPVTSFTEREALAFGHGQTI